METNSGFPLVSLFSCLFCAFPALKDSGKVTCDMEHCIIVWKNFAQMSVTTDNGSVGIIQSTNNC